MELGTFFVNVECAIHKNDKWLMIVRSEQEEHAAGFLSMVGGTVEYSDANETVLENAVRREIKEEIGVTISSQMHYLESKHFVTNKGERVLDVVFLAEYESGEPAAISRNEIESVEWMTFEEIEKHHKTPSWIMKSMQQAEVTRLKGIPTNYT